MSNFKTSVLQTARLPICIREDGFPNLQDVDTGVVFVHALWSGDSISSLSCLCKVLQEANVQVKIYVLSADGLDYDAFQKQYGSFPTGGGRGEAFWINSGELIASDPGYCIAKSEALIRSRIANLSN
ncbi:MAG: hypothetical protein IPM23_15045 [Candidatus Melainabacteria bacterium]|nr:hypothetical protein [Candidatus Melainabacteria bacterium]